MTGDELKEKLELIQRMKCETQTLEIKSAHSGCPKRLFDTLSSFANQDEGGTIVFGIDESDGYRETGVYDPQDIQKKINEQCLQMEPVVRPLLTVIEKEGKFFVSAEIPGIDISERPCYYRGKGQAKGSYVRIGDSDEPMTDYEIHSYEAFRRKYRDDIRDVPRVNFTTLNRKSLDDYTERLKSGKPHLANIEERDICELMSITKGGQVTLAAEMLFGLYPQAYFPQLCITAVAVPGNELGDTGSDGERFYDNRRIEGTIPEMLNEAIAFVKRNMKNSTIIDPETGKREDVSEYPITAVREAILNALIHRDYSLHTEGMPICIRMFDNRLEIENPGGLYGRIKIDQLGKVQPDTRNPVLAAALEVLGVTENRYSGIPTIRKEMKKYGLPEPRFADRRGEFSVTFYKEHEYPDVASPDVEDDDVMSDVVAFCRTPRSRAEIAEHLDLSSVSYAIKTYVTPLVREGRIKMTIPETPKSPKQLFYSE